VPTITATGGGSVVRLTVIGLAPGATYETQLHAATCSTPNAIFTDLLSLTTDAGGRATASGPFSFHRAFLVPLANPAAGMISIFGALPDSVLTDGPVACGELVSTADAGS
jgi:hypothetical protein